MSAANNSKLFSETRLLQGLCGLFPGIVGGLFLWMLLGSEFDETGERYFPWIWVVGGGLGGFVVGYLVGGITIRGRLLRIIQGIHWGATIGTLLALFTSLFLPAFDDKDRAVNLWVTIPTGLVLGSLLGGLLGCFVKQKEAAPINSLTGPEDRG